MKVSRSQHVRVDAHLLSYYPTCLFPGKLTFDRAQLRLQNKNQKWSVLVRFTDAKQKGSVYTVCLSKDITSFLILNRDAHLLFKKKN